MTAVATILICVALIAVGSYALFSDTTRVTNHLQAGDLDIKLWRIDLAGKGLDDKGFMTDVKDTLDKDFTSTTTDNIFNLDNTKYVVPTSKYVAEMMIARNQNARDAVGSVFCIRLDRIRTDPLPIACMHVRGLQREHTDKSDQDKKR